MGLPVKTGAMQGLRTYLRETAEPIQAAALTLPLLVCYGVGILVVPEARNGADLVSSALHGVMARLGPSEALAYLGFYGLLAVANVGLIMHLSKNTRFSPRWFWAVLGEAAVYAVAVGTVAGNLTQDLTHMLQASNSANVTHHTGIVAGVVMSAGAGLHEELLFRLAGMGAIGRLWLGANWRTPSLQLLALMLGTALVFSAAHHIVEPFAIVPFVFRTIAGLLFGTLFLLRGFAVAAWTHALYDVWVIVFLQS
jgi:hypothetical protein